MPTGTDKLLQSQLDKFKQAARDLDCDEDAGRFEDKLKKIVRQKPGVDQSKGG